MQTFCTFREMESLVTVELSEFVGPKSGRTFYVVTVYQGGALGRRFTQRFSSEREQLECAYDLLSTRCLRVLHEPPKNPDRRQYTHRFKPGPERLN